MRTPAPHAWEGAYWGNHNSRDNFPDLGIGYVTAMAISKDEGAPAKLRALAEEVVAGGRRIATSIVESGGALMTVDEHNPYDKLVVAGALRPDGVVEPEDLGSLAFCGMAYLAQAMSSEGLDLPVPARPVPGSYEHLIDTLPSSIQTNCEVPEGVKLCVSLDDAFCGFTWSEIDKLELFGVPWLDAIEAAGVGLAEELLGSFQDDFSEMVDTTVALALYAQVAGRPELEREAKELVGEMGAIMRRFGELLWKESNPDRLRRQRYEAALKEAIAGVGPAVEDLGELDEAEAHIKRIEGQLELAETEPAPLLSDEEIKKRIDDRLADKRSNQYDYVVAERYEAEYGSEYPVRRTESGYEARGFPFEEHPWKAVEVPSHRYVGGGHLLEALALCQSAPTVLDCTWAVLGCAAADFDGSGVVDEKDALIFYSAEDRHAGMGPGSCTEENQRCDGADLDLTGEVDDLDTRFFETATGCRR